MKQNQTKHTLEEITEFGQYFNKCNSIQETAEYFNVKYDTMKGYLTRYGFRKPSRKVKVKQTDDCTYFDKIDSHEKAYFLGFLYSDGYVCKNNYGLTMGIALQIADKYIIDRLHSEMNLTNGINIYKNSAKLCCSNLHLCECLKNLGIKEDKSNKDFSIPNINKEYLNSFILGYFDGDGCITIKSTGYSVVSICCNSKQFLSEIKQVLDDNKIQTRPLNCETKNRKNPLYVLYLSGKENQIRFYN